MKGAMPGVKAAPVNNSSKSAAFVTGTKIPGGQHRNMAATNRSVNFAGSNTGPRDFSVVMSAAGQNNSMNPGRAGESMSY